MGPRSHSRAADIPSSLNINTFSTLFQIFFCFLYELLLIIEKPQNSLRAHLYWLTRADLLVSSDRWTRSAAKNTEKKLSRASFGECGMGELEKILSHTLNYNSPGKKKNAMAKKGNIGQVKAKARSFSGILQSHLRRRRRLSAPGPGDGNGVEVSVRRRGRRKWRVESSLFTNCMFHTIICLFSFRSHLYFWFPLLPLFSNSGIQRSNAEDSFFCLLFFCFNFFSTRLLLRFTNDAAAVAALGFSLVLSLTFFSVDSSRLSRKSRGKYLIYLGDICSEIRTKKFLWSLLAKFKVFFLLVVDLLLFGAGWSLLCCVAQFTTFTSTLFFSFFLLQLARLRFSLFSLFCVFCLPITRVN